MCIHVLILYTSVSAHPGMYIDTYIKTMYTDTCSFFLKTEIILKLKRLAILWILGY